MWKTLNEILQENNYKFPFTVKWSRLEHKGIKDFYIRIIRGEGIYSGGYTYYYPESIDCFRQHGSFGENRFADWAHERGFVLINTKETNKPEWF